MLHISRFSSKSIVNSTKTNSGSACDMTDTITNCLSDTSGLSAAAPPLLLLRPQGHLRAATDRRRLSDLHCWVKERAIGEIRVPIAARQRDANQPLLLFACVTYLLPRPDLVRPPAVDGIAAVYYVRTKVKEEEAPLPIDV